MDLRNLQESNSLKAEHLQGKQVSLTINNTEIIQVEKTSRQGEKYTANAVRLIFAETDKTFVCNQTNLQAIMDLSQRYDNDAWPGIKITFFPTKTQFGNQTVDCIRVWAVNGVPNPAFNFQQAQNFQQPQNVQQPQQQYNELNPPPVQNIDDEIPF